MELEYYKVQKKEKAPIVCPHNEACRCLVKDCYHCGWHPKVAKMRAERLQRKLNGGN